MCSTLPKQCWAEPPRNDKFESMVKFGIFRFSRATQCTDQDKNRHVSVDCVGLLWHTKFGQDLSKGVGTGAPTFPKIGRVCVIMSGYM